MAEISIVDLFMGGLVLLTIGASQALQRIIPKQYMNNQRSVVIREMFTKKEIIRDPIQTHKGVSIICPYCNKVFR